MNKKAVGGWIKGVKPVASGEYYRLEDFVVHLNPEHINYFEDYRIRYFFDFLVSDQGMENVFDMLKKCVGHPESWIDLGASVTTLFWSIGFNTKHLKTVEVCDLIPEALQVLRTFKETNEIPRCYLDALKLTSKSKKDFMDLRNKSWEYHVFDCLGKWPSHFNNRHYKLITAIGCFGLSTNSNQYQNAFSHATSHLAHGGMFIGVDWVRSRCFIEDEGHDNTYLNIDLITQCGIGRRLMNRHAELVYIRNDPYYDHMIIWAFQKPDE